MGGIGDLHRPGLGGIHKHRTGSREKGRKNSLGTCLLMSLSTAPPPVCLLQQPSDYTVHPKVLGPAPVYNRSSNCHNPVSEASHPPASNNSSGVGAASGSFPGSCPGVLAFVKLGAVGVAGHMVPAELDRK